MPPGVPPRPAPVGPTPPPDDPRPAPLDPVPVDVLPPPVDVAPRPVDDVPVDGIAIVPAVPPELPSELELFAPDDELVPFAALEP